jgi:hypothetical protein
MLNGHERTARGALESWKNVIANRGVVRDSRKLCDPLKQPHFSCWPSPRSRGSPSAQSYDSSGDSMLNGVYYIRQVIYLVNNCAAPQGTATGGSANTYGNITFDGKGGYKFRGSYYDPNVANTPTPFTSSGTYVISASGMGYITAINPELSAADLIIGLVSAKGIFIGSSTQNTQSGAIGYNDLVIAAPVSSTPATNVTLKGSYAVAYFDPTFFPNNATSSTLPGGDALLTFTADGQGHIGTVKVTGYTSDNTTASTESLSGVTYAFSDGGQTSP